MYLWLQLEVSVFLYHGILLTLIFHAGGHRTNLKPRAEAVCELQQAN